MKEKRFQTSIISFKKKPLLGIHKIFVYNRKKIKKKEIYLDKECGESLDRLQETAEKKRQDR